MQFLRSDEHHIDSCWITWNHPDLKIKATIYPMLHIANRVFYERLSNELARCQYVLYEGVTWHLDEKRRPLYDLLAKNLGIASQENTLRMPAEATKVNLDMDRLEFRKRFFRLPLRSIIGFLFLRHILWILTFTQLLRDRFVRYGLLRRRRKYETYNDRPLNQLVLSARDKRIVENMTKFFHDRIGIEENVFIGIVFGSAHMPAISACLRSLGYRAATRRWVEVFRYFFNAKDVA
jgi:hypothetical protein